MKRRSSCLASAPPPALPRHRCADCPNVTLHRVPMIRLAQSNLADMYMEGQGVKKDETKAFELCVCASCHCCRG